MIRWVFNDFRLKHLIWIKVIFFFQSASMTVLYPFLNLHMKSLGLSIQEVAIINAVIPVSYLMLLYVILLFENIKRCLWFIDYYYSFIFFSDPIYIHPSINRLSCKTMLQFSNHVIDSNCLGRFSSFRFVSHPSRSRYHAVPKNIELGNQLWKTKQPRTISKGMNTGLGAIINLWHIWILHLHPISNSCFYF